MTVSIDPSQIRRQDTVKGQPSSGRPRLALRTLLLGGLGGSGLLAFTIGAFSFFGGLADPRVRNPRPAPIASQMPDLKDGQPVLVSGNGAAAPVPTVLNLPRPPAPVPGPDRTEIALRTDTAAEAVIAPAPRPAAADATGSVAQRNTAAPLAKASPGIENAATVSGDAKPAPLIAPARTAGPLAPAKAETVRAKPAAVASLPAEPPVPRPAAKRAAAQEAAPEPRAAAVRKPLQKVARIKGTPAAEASAEPEATPAPAAAAEPEEEGFTSKVKSGIKAIGSVFGED